jgi:Protein of unknown function (DUF3052)
LAGYSQKPLWDKLGLRGDDRVVLVDAPASLRIPGRPANANVQRELARDRADGAADAIVAFFVSLSALAELLPALARRIFPDGALWVAWPRRAAGHDSDIRESDVRELALPRGLVDVKVAAIGEDWSGLRLVWRVERRQATPAERG